MGRSVVPPHTPVLGEPRLIITLEMTGANTAQTQRNTGGCSVERNPDPEEPEAPVVEVGVKIGSPAGVVEPTLIDAAPAEVRRWWRGRPSGGPQAGPLGPPGPSQCWPPDPSCGAAPTGPPSRGGGRSPEPPRPPGSSDPPPRVGGGPPGRPSPWQLPTWGPHGGVGCAAAMPAPPVSGRRRDRRRSLRHMSDA